MTTTGNPVMVVMQLRNGHQVVFEHPRSELHQYAELDLAGKVVRFHLRSVKGDTAVYLEERPRGQAWA